MRRRGAGEQGSRGELRLTRIMHPAARGAQDFPASRFSPPLHFSRFPVPLLPCSRPLPISFPAHISPGLRASMRADRLLPCSSVDRPSRADDLPYAPPHSRLQLQRGTSYVDRREVLSPGWRRYDRPANCAESGARVAAAADRHRVVVSGRGAGSAQRLEARVPRCGFRGFLGGRVHPRGIQPAARAAVDARAPAGQRRTNYKDGWPLSQWFGKRFRPSASCSSCSRCRPCTSCGRRSTAKSDPECRVAGWRWKQPASCA